MAEIPLSLQAKLLRALQEREVRRVEITANAPLTRACWRPRNESSPASIRAGRFREDLALRLRVIELRVPPLRERAEDLPLLARQTLHEASERAQIPRESYHLKP